MADDTSPKSEPEIVEPPAAPPSREPRHDPGVIEGEATEVREAAPPEPPTAEAATGEPASEQPSAEPTVGANAPESRLETRRTGVPFLTGALGAVVGAALALGAAWLIDPRAAALDAATAHLAELERGDQAQLQTNADFEKRLGALEASESGLAKAEAVDALARRLAALESAPNKDEAAQAALAEARAARADAAKALALAAGSGQTTAAPAQGGAPAAFDASALLDRLGAVESELAALKSREADLGALDGRVAKIESALAAPKSEARVAATEVGASRGGAAEAILAISLNERLHAGAPFAQEWAALTRLGADSAKLAALKPFADAGAPTFAALAASFAKISPSLVAAAAPPSNGGAMDRLFDHMSKLVRVHKVGEVAGGDAGTLVSRISTALARGDLPAALDAYKDLPDAARQASEDWAKAAEARQAASVAARGLRADAVARLAEAKN
ncbi:MAG: hypothetical protein ABSC22_05330 [Roseiarcus sp.]|jgi:hypothetical protein